jgi:hypothetical protein
MVPVFCPRPFSFMAWQLQQPLESRRLEILS